MSDTHGRSNAIAVFGSICELIQRLRAARDADDQDAIEAVEQEIHEMPLAVDVRGGWYSPGADKPDPEEFQILLTTGGPACRIHGKIGLHGEPEDPELQSQDWGSPWTFVYPTSEEYAGDDVPEILLEFCQQFYFGE